MGTAESTAQQQPPLNPFAVSALATASTSAHTSAASSPTAPPSAPGALFQQPFAPAASGSAHGHHKPRRPQYVTQSPSSAPAAHASAAAPPSTFGAAPPVAPVFHAAPATEAPVASFSGPPTGAHPFAHPPAAVPAAATIPFAAPPTADAVFGGAVHVAPDAGAFFSSAGSGEAFLPAGVREGRRRSSVNSASAAEARSWFG